MDLLPIRDSPVHRDGDATLPRDLDGPLVACVDVAEDAHRRVRGQDPAELLGGEVGAVGDDDHPGMLAIADPDAAAVVDRDPRRAGGGVDESVQEWPVRYCI